MHVVELSQLESSPDSSQIFLLNYYYKKVSNCSRIPLSKVSMSWTQLESKNVTLVAQNMNLIRILVVKASSSPDTRSRKEAGIDKRLLFLHFFPIRWNKWNWSSGGSTTLGPGGSRHFFQLLKCNTFSNFASVFSPRLNCRHRWYRQWCTSSQPGRMLLWRRGFPDRRSIRPQRWIIPFPSM